MTSIPDILDPAMSVLWMLVYTLVLTGSIRYKYPLICPLTQAVIAPLEFAVLIWMIAGGSYGFNYVFLAYLYWSIIEIVTICVYIKKRYIQKPYIALYCGFIFLLTAIMVPLVSNHTLMFYNYLNTFCGMNTWLFYILGDIHYPMRPIALGIFIVKLVADIFAFMVYFGRGSAVTTILCMMLPVIDSLFIPIYFHRRKCKEATYEPKIM